MTYSGYGSGLPSYLRRAPRWYDGAGRLLDLGGTLDARVRPELDDERLAEDFAMMRRDLRRALAEVTAREA
jgi:hypothetical protein